MAGLSRALGALAFVSLFATGASAADPVSFPGSSWSGTGIISIKVPGAGKLAGEVSFDLDFGPQADPALADDEFLLVLDDGMETLDVHGSYAVDEKGRLALLLDVASLGAELEALTLHVCQDVLMLGSQCDVIALLDLVFDPTRQKLKIQGRSKDGVDSLKASGKFPFALSEGDEAVARLAIGFKASRGVTRD